MKAKTAALALLGIVSLVAPLIERLATVVALPVYFVRSRGWRRGMVATGWAAVILGATYLLGEAGERLAAVFAS